MDPYRETLVVLQSMQQALAAYDAGDWTRAEQLCRAVLEARGDYFDALNLLGILAAQTERLPEAVALLEAAVAARPNAPSAHNNLGNAQREGRRFEDALASYGRAIALRGDYAEAYDNRGLALQGLGRHQAALADHDRALQLNAGLAAAHLNRGNALQALRRHADAVAAYERAQKLDRGLVDALVNRGNALCALGRHTEALKSYEVALKRKPDHADAYYCRAIALEALERFDDALTAYDAAIALQPDHAEAHWNKSLVLLAQGRMRDGLPLYEWRWRRPGSGLVPRDFDAPRWTGHEPLEGRTILLYAEQGLGDTLNFCRYVPLVARRGARVVVEAQPALLPLLGGVEGVAEVVARGAPLPAFDLQCPLLSLPLAFGTEVATIPASVPYLAADAAHRDRWRARLGERTRPRIGLVWSGGTLSSVRERSIPLERFAALLNVDAEFVSLQQEVRDADRAVLDARPDIRHFGPALEDFADTAALCELMDLVISIDTSTAHLAGALGRPLWVLLRHNPDWRWFRDRADSPWYPGATLYRQTRADIWDDVLEQVGSDLARWSAGA